MIARTKIDASLLYVEDEEATREMLAQFFRHRVREVFVARDGQEGLRLFRERAPDIVVTDVLMPGMSGLEMVRRIRETDRDVEIMVTTALTDASSLLEAIELGVDRYVLKPVDTDRLQRALVKCGEVIEGRRSRRRHADEQEHMIAELQRLNSLLLHQATTDPLTGIPNRLKFDQELRSELERARRLGTPLAIIICDIDHFKRVNDTHGHQAGDQVLKALAGLMADQVRLYDTLARWGGEEFAVLLPHTGLDHAVTVAEKLRQRIRTWTFPSVGSVTCSFGVAELQDDDDPDRLIHRVDAALYRAKEQGRDRVVAAPQGEA